jgi:hypothetical protein
MDPSDVAPSIEAKGFAGCGLYWELAQTRPYAKHGPELWMSDLKVVVTMQGRDKSSAPTEGLISERND